MSKKMYLISEDEFKALEVTYATIFTNPIKERGSITEKELKLAVKMLDYASDVFGSHCCNDLPEEFWKGWTHDERMEFYRQYEIWNSEGRDYDPEMYRLHDYAVMGFLAHKLSNDIKSPHAKEAEEIKDGCKNGCPSHSVCPCPSCPEYTVTCIECFKTAKCDHEWLDGLWESPKETSE